MINSLKELRVKLSSDDLIKYYFESLNKTPEQILSLLKSKGIDATIECANECYEFCKKVIAIEEKELNIVSGGTAHPSFPENVSIEVERCIAILDGKITGDVQFVRGKTQSLSTLLKRTLNEPYNPDSLFAALQTVLLTINVDSYFSPELGAVYNIANNLRTSLY